MANNDGDTPLDLAIRYNRKGILISNSSETGYDKYIYNIFMLSFMIFRGCGPFGGC